MTMIIIIVGILGGLFLQGLRQIQASPPHKGQATWLGERVPGKVYNEGWGWYPIFPYLSGFILVKVERVTFEVVSEKTRTPDRAESRVPVTITFRPTLLSNYIDSGQENGVKHQLAGKIQERIREWAAGPEEGPANWEELNQAHLEAVSVLVKKLARNSLTEIPDYAQQVPTWIWLRYFAQPQPRQFTIIEKWWTDNNWQRVREELDKIGPEKTESLKTAVKKRREEIEALRTGTGKIALDDLGVMLERLNLGDIDVLGEVGKKAEEEAKEVQERKAEIVELEHFIERVKALMAPLPTGAGLTREQALEQVQLSIGKTTKTINANTIAFDQPTAQIIAAIFGRRP
ncbi:MAG: SPFH domain-containing protein [Patescibacteria group bacterium]